MTSDPKEALERLKLEIAFYSTCTEDQLRAQSYTLSGARQLAADLRTLIAKQEGLEREVAAPTKQSSQFQEWYGQANRERNAAEQNAEAWHRACQVAATIIGLREPEAQTFAEEVRAEIERLRDLIANPPEHVWWGAGEPDCPKDIKAGNGELHTLRCKACGEDDPRNPTCPAALSNQGKPSS